MLGRVFSRSQQRSVLRTPGVIQYCGVADVPFKTHDKPLKTSQFGIDILHDPLWNKGTAFTQYERDRLGLRGLLPPVVKTIEEQIERTVGHLGKLESNVDKNMYLQSLHNRYAHALAFAPATISLVKMRVGHSYTIPLSLLNYWHLLLIPLCVTCV